MNILLKTGLAALVVSAAACGPVETSKANEVVPANSKKVAETHSATGTVDKVAGLQVTISHGPVESLGWPAMTMPFTAKDAASLAGIKAGDRVAFAFSKSGNESVLTSITKQ